MSDFSHTAVVEPHHDVAAVGAERLEQRQHAVPDLAPPNVPAQVAQPSEGVAVAVRAQRLARDVRLHGRSFGRVSDAVNKQAAGGCNSQQRASCSCVVEYPCCQRSSR